MNDNLLLDLTPAEVEIIRRSLRLQHDTHKRNDFQVLAKLVLELSNKINDAILDNNRASV